MQVQVTILLRSMKYVSKCKWRFCSMASSNYCMRAIVSDHSVAEHEVCGQGQVHIIDTPDLTRKPKFRNNHPKSINLSIYLPTDLSWSIYRICIYIIYIRILSIIMYLFVYLFVYIILYLSINLSINGSIYLSIYRSIYLAIYIYLPTYLSSQLATYLSIHILI